MGVPKLRFAGFSDHYETKTMMDVCKINQGLQIPISERLTTPSSNCHFYITNEFLKEGSSKKYYIENAASTVICDDNDLLMTRTGNTGTVVKNVRGVFHNNFFKIKCNNLVLKDFLYYFLVLEKTQRLILKLAGTSTIPDLNHGDFYSIEISLPTISEQIKITQFLIAIDEKISLLNKEYKLLYQYKKGMMQKIFNQELRFKDENGDVYSAWKIKPLKELYTLLNTNSLSRSELNYESGNIKNIHYGDIHTKFNGRFDITKELVPYISKTIKIAEECYCRKGDLVIADASEDYNDIGKCIEITNVNQQQVVAGLHTFLARPNTTMALGFGSYMMQSSEVRRQIKVIATGVSVLSITKKNLLELMIPLPSIDEQTKIANFFSALDDKVAVKKAELDKLKTWKQGLLQQMFV
ncbi:restriction endonuclease subunit S [Raoultella planticola]